MHTYIYISISTNIPIHEWNKIKKKKKGKGGKDAIAFLKMRYTSTSEDQVHDTHHAFTEDKARSENDEG
jgi:hypothetical protein